MTKEQPNKTLTPSAPRPRILAYTVTHGSRGFLPILVPAMRRTAGAWFDWLVVLSGAAEHQHLAAKTLLKDKEHIGIQHLLSWPENRGQHHATAAALDLARREGYDWLLRIDDDITPKTQRWLKKMLERNTVLHRRAGLPPGDNRLILCPQVVGLKHPVKALGIIESGSDAKFPDVEVVPFMGGACRLMPVKLLEGYTPPLWGPRGRQDPQSLASFLHTLPHDSAEPKGFFIRFTDIRVRHHTKRLEAQDTDEDSQTRRMNLYWPWIEAYE